LGAIRIIIPNIIARIADIVKVIDAIFYPLLFILNPKRGDLFEGIRFEQTSSPGKKRCVLVLTT
jgi:hypothetical protein